MLIELQYPKTIGDPIHGYIPLTELEYQIIQLPILNRLHFVRQTALAFLVFPGSVTTRFSHVVGALHIGGKIISQLLSHLGPAEFQEVFGKESKAEFIVQSIRLACLFHDLGHGPFSHAAEDSMLKVTKKYHKDEITEAMKLFGKENENELPLHEFFSYKLVKKSEIAQEIRTFKGTKEGDLMVDFVSNLLIKKQTKSFIAKHTNFKLLMQIVSSQLDADRMDYLLRDSLMSGVKFGLVDVDRIIKNMKIMKDSRGKYQIAFHERAMGAIEDMLDARYKMYRWFYSHHTVVMTNDLIRRAIEMMVSSNVNLAKLFHWSSYEGGKSTDDYILFELLRRTESSKYEKLKGLVDRRYMPVSLFKSTPDSGRMIHQITKILGFDLSRPIVRNHIESFFKKDGEEKLKQRLEKLQGELSKCVVFQTDVKMKPYTPFEESDRVYLFRSNEAELCELSGESEYFSAINNEWARFNGLYVFYLIPSKKKQAFSEYKEMLRSIIAEEIAGTFT